MSQCFLNSVGYNLVHWEWHVGTVWRIDQHAIFRSSSVKFWIFRCFYCSFFSPLLHVEGYGTIIWDITAFFQWTPIVHNHHTISYFMSFKFCASCNSIQQTSKHSDSMCYDFLIKAYFKILMWSSSNTIQYEPKCISQVGACMQ